MLVYVYMANMIVDDDKINSIRLKEQPIGIWIWIGMSTVVLTQVNRNRQRQRQRMKGHIITSQQSLS